MSRLTKGLRLCMQLHCKSSLDHMMHAAIDHMTMHGANIVAQPVCASVLTLRCTQWQSEVDTEVVSRG